MVNPNAVMSMTISFDPPLDRPAAEILRGDREILVRLDGGQQVRLHPADPRSAGFAQVLDGLREQGHPVYVEADPETGAMTRLLIPHVTYVLAIHTFDDRLVIELDRSHAQHVLTRSARDFAELEEALREALRSASLVILTEDDAHNIIDVRPANRGPEGAPFPFREPWPLPRPVPRPRLIDLLQRVWRWCGWPWWWRRYFTGCLSSTRAQTVFDDMASRSCDPLTVPAPCIPFLYPDDGCWGRAHEMRRLMVDMGLSPKKVWIQGNLRTPTRNNPMCSVAWGWHVAPTLCVRWFWCFGREMVIDPSLFATPVTKTVWKGVQGDPTATLTDSAGEIFYLWGGVTDPGYVQTNQVLQMYRLQLQARSIQHGPPPYANCP